MARNNPDLTQLRELRRKQGLTQCQFWPLFGVAQKGGSRYEGGRALPRPVALLISSWLLGKLTDEDLHKAGKSLVRRRRQAGSSDE